MDDQEKEGREDSVQVLGGAAQEVVRLNAPQKKERMEKSGVVAAKKIEIEHMKEVAEGKVSPQFDPEEEWLNENPEKGGRAVPMGWFALLGMILLGLVGWAGYQVLSSSGKSLVADSEAVAIRGGDKTLEEVADRDAIREAAEHFEKTEEVLRGFFGAASFEERAKYVRHPERVKPLMADYYSRNEYKAVTYRKIVGYRIFPLENRPFLVLQVEDEDGEDHAVLLEDGVDGGLVDWESFVCFQPVSIEDYARDRPTESTTFRAYLSPDYFHSYEFESEEEFASFRISFRDSEVRFNGYVKRGTELEQKFRKLFPLDTKSQFKPLIVKVRFLEGGKAKNSVVIEGVESIIWAYASNPAEVASPLK